jgi:hypothetical protein
MYRYEIYNNFLYIVFFFNIKYIEGRQRRSRSRRRRAAAVAALVPAKLL